MTSTGPYFDVCIYDDVGMPFTDETVATQALGGSEFVVWQLAHEWARRGKSVLVWQGRGEPREVKGGPNGLITYRFGPSTMGFRADLFIHHRYSGLAYESLQKEDGNFLVTWNRRFVLCTDLFGTHYSQGTVGMLACQTPVVCVSETQAIPFRAHRNVLDRHRQEPFGWDVRVIPNPIPTDAYDRTLYRPDPNRFVYASAALKGLRATLEAWRELKRDPVFKDARLRVLSPGYDDSSFAAGLEGVQYVGPVQNSAVIDELRQAAGLFYVNDFPETFCLVAAYAEAVGARVHCLVRNGGAIPETVTSPFVTSDRNTFLNDFKRAFRQDVSAPDPKNYRIETIVDAWDKFATP